MLALNNEETVERKADSASKLKKKIKFAFKNKSSLRKMRVILKWLKKHSNLI